MTALDKAFIRAYQQTGSPPRTVPLEFAAPVLLEETLIEPAGQPRRSKGPSRSRVLSALAGHDAASTPTTARGGSKRGSRKTATGSRVDYPAEETPVLADAPAASTKKQPKGKTGERAVPSQPQKRKNVASKGELPSLSVSKATAVPASRLSLASLGVPLPSPPSRKAKPKTPPEPVQDEIENNTLAIERPAEDKPATLPPLEMPAAGPPSKPVPEPPTAPLRPMLQVDNFAWPAVCTKLTPAAAAQIDQLAIGLMGSGVGRPRVVGVVGSGRGAGCTTLLLGAARRLADRGMKIVLVDGDFDNPQLTSRLGLAPEFGWEEVLGGRLPVAEVLIESLDDHLVLLPWRDRSGRPAESFLIRGLGAVVDPLANHFDLVLVDLGAMENGTEVAVWDGRLDAAVLVHNVRTGRIEQLARARYRLIGVGVRLLGVAENFASPGASHRRAA